MIPENEQGLFRRTLLSGRFNLLLGAGISLSSTNKRGDRLMSSEALRQSICKAKGLNEGSPLSRASKHLTPEDIKSLLVEPFSVFKAAPELIDLLRYPWNRIFTFNIDDAIEVAHAHCTDRNQSILQPLHFKENFVENKSPDVLSLVHLHGSVRNPADPFVFSYRQYAELTIKPNVWMALLSQYLATEPFIVAGTTLNEPDLEHYLSFRTPATSRLDWGPSLLIEPTPDEGTEKDCAQHQLRLLRCDLASFVNWLRGYIPTAPRAIERLAPGLSGLFSMSPEQTHLQLFLQDFEYLNAASVGSPDLGSPFFFGSSPTWADLNAHYDIDRADYEHVAKLVRKALSKAKPGRKRAVVVEGTPGDGKSTILHRIAYDLARDAVPVFVARAKAKIDLEAAMHCLERMSKQPVVVVDGLAESARDLLDLCDSFQGALVVLSAERGHRMGYARSILPEDFPDPHTISNLDLSERKKLIHSYTSRGLIANREAIKHPDAYAEKLAGDAVAIAVCRLLNDFKPLSRIISEVWNDASQDMQQAYVPCALGYMCRQQGVRYMVLQACLPRGTSLRKFITSSIPLPLARNSDDLDFIIPGNGTFGEQLVRWLSHEDTTSALLGGCVSLGKALAPWVNVKNIGLRPPEARLAARLFNADELIIPLLGADAETLFQKLESQWSWHSQYWAQRALTIRQSDLALAIQYARHGRSLEPTHPSPSNTLASLLFQATQELTASHFDEAFDMAMSSIREAQKRRWAQEHSFVTLFSGVVDHLEKGRSLSPRQLSEIRDLLIKRPWPSGGRSPVADRLSEHLNNLLL